MKKDIINTITVIFIFILIYEMITDSKIIIDSMNLAFTMWSTSIFPGLFPFFVVCSMLIYLGIPEFIGELLKSISYKLFKIKQEGAFVIIMSLLTGFPSSSKLCSSLLEDGVITEKEATKLLMFTHFSNPLFISGTICVVFLKDISYLPIIMFSHYMGNIIIGLLVRNLYRSDKPSSRPSLKRAYLLMKQKQSKTNLDIGGILINSVKTSITTMFTILGIISAFVVLTSIINYHLSCSDVTRALINGIFEMTHGIKDTTLLDIALNSKVILITCFLSFGGLSVHMQVYSFISETNIKYSYFFLARIMHVIISGSICYLLLYM